MPELPEVQTTVNYLKPRLVGLRIKDVWSDWAKTVVGAGGILNFQKEIKDKKIISVHRRAKFIVIDMEGDKSIFIHQKISGHLLYGKWIKSNKQLGTSDKQSQIWIARNKGPLRDERENQYIRVVFDLSNGYQLALSDLRRFGKIILVKDKDVSNLKAIRDLGPEPLDIEFMEFKKLFNKKRGRLKQVLMDPFFIVGIGNIYSDEILWKADLHPLSRVENLSEKDLKNILRHTKEVLKKAIKYGGSSVDDYRLPSGEKGEFQNMQFAYHQTGKKCAKKDGGIIERLKLGGRSAHFCPAHQALK